MWTRARAAIAMLALGSVACSLLFRDYDARFGSSVAIVTDDADVGKLVVASGWLYYVSGVTTIRRVPLDAGADASSSVWSQEPMNVSSLAVDDAGTLAWALSNQKSGSIKIESSSDPSSDAGILATIDAAVSAIAIDGTTVTFGLECNPCTTVMGTVDATKKVTIFTAPTKGENVGAIIEGPNGAHLGTTGTGLTYLLANGAITECTPVANTPFANDSPNDIDFASGKYWFSETKQAPFSRVPPAQTGCPDFTQAVTIDAGVEGPGLVAHADDGTVVFVDSASDVWKVSTSGAVTKIGSVPAGANGSSKAIAVGAGRVFVARGPTIYALALP